MSSVSSNFRRRLAHFIDIFNFTLPVRLHLFEFCDLPFVPFAVKQCAQNTLTAHWTQRIPFLQERAPAKLAADLIDEVFHAIEGDGLWKVVDFCSGSGGPTPHIERHLNSKRVQEGRAPVQFFLSDLHPNLDAWIEHASHSANLSFIPDPVDATNPPFAAISSSTPGDKEAARDRGLEHDGCKVFRLFCLAFHHFDDEGAQRVIKSTMNTSNAFVILELQERRIGSVLLMTLELGLLFLMAVFWYPNDWLYLFFTYILPVLPPMHAFDGMVSCLRTRTFEEFVDLLDAALGKNHRRNASSPLVTVQRGDWVFTNYRVLHTWPVGYMNAIVGTRVDAYDDL
ncbi:hypothetical protein Q7P37_003864 [Cladosporium fusiforme]